MAMTRRARRAATVSAVIAVVLGALAWWLAEPGEGTAVALAPDDAGTVALGREVYARECAGCHGAALEGQQNWRQRKPDGRLPAPPHDETGHTWHHPDGQLYALTKYGPAALIGGDYRSDMPAYEGALSDGEIIAVLSFIKSTWPPAIRDQHDDLNRRARGQN
jgi:mono/diheme cytochrome c family protein